MCFKSWYNFTSHYFARQKDLNNRDEDFSSTDEDNENDSDYGEIKRLDDKGIIRRHTVVRNKDKNPKLAFDEG